MSVIDKWSGPSLSVISGYNEFDGVPHYLIDWCPSLIPKVSMEYATELVAKFEARPARIRMRRGVKGRRKEGPDLNNLAAETGY